MTDLIPSPAPTALGEPSRARIRSFLEARRAPSTRRTYASLWKDFAYFCATSGRQAMPASVETVADYLSSLAEHGAKPGSLGVRVSAISAAHREKNQEDPTKTQGIRDLMGGIRRKLAIATRKAAPVIRPRLLAFADSYDTGTLTGLRNRALMLTGYAGAYRESELAALRVEDIHWQEDGSAMILVRKSKTDQEGQGKWKPLPRLEFSDYCPASAVRAWLSASGIESGPLWRRIWRGGRKVGTAAIHPQTVYHLVKKAAAATGLDPAIYSGHSLRAGFATQHSLDGGAPQDGMEVTGHSDMRTFMGYARTGGRLARRASTLALTGK